MFTLCLRVCLCVCLCVVLGYTDVYTVCACVYVSVRVWSVTKLCGCLKYNFCHFVSISASPGSGFGPVATMPCLLIDGDGRSDYTSGEFSVLPH